MVAFLLIVGLSFWAMAGFMSSMIGDYLFDERISMERTRMETLAEKLAPSLRDRDVAALLSEMSEEARELGGVMVLTDQNGKVQLDTQNIRTGTRLDIPQVTDILVDGQRVSYAIRDAETGQEIVPSWVLFMNRTGSRWESVYAAAMIYDSDVIGVLILITPAETAMRSVYQLQERTLLIFAAIAAAALLFSFIFARVVTRPVAGLTRGIQHMAKGDFSSRVEVRGSREMMQLAEAFNSMSERLESLDQSRNQFVSNASHELKTPLATMKIMIESLIYQPDMDRDLRTEFLTDINSEIDRLSAIVSDLLTLVKMDSKDVRLQRESLSVAELCRENEHRLKPIAEKKGQTITLSLQDECEMYADKSKLNQVIYNLVENAIKYTPQGGKIRVSLSRQGHDAHLVISDNGPGIAKESLPHIFDRFYRVDKARSRETGGTGLGLSIVRQLVLLHGGSIHCESEVGKGSNFIVDLPLHQG
ncbi:MAG: HAMP domain-containing protein [Clostridia bacterium]|nr:HAMP domain-containing protein [Clostridia bacterium]